jgi:hypothetical protein
MSGKMSLMDISSANIDQIMHLAAQEAQEAREDAEDEEEIVSLRRHDNADFQPDRDPENFTRQKLWTTDYTLELKQENDNIIEALDISEDGKSFLAEMIRYVGAKDYKFGNLNAPMMNDVIRDFKMNWVKGMAMLPRSDRRNPIFGIVLRFLQSTLRTEISRAMGPERLDIISRTYFMNKNQSHYYKDGTFVQPPSSGFSLFNRKQGEQ